MASEAGAVIGVLFSIFFLACLYWFYDRYYAHPKVDDDERYDELREGEKKPVSVSGSSNKRSPPSNKSNKVRPSNDISSLLFPEVVNPLVDLELGSHMDIDDDDNQGESLENVVIEGICKAGYLKKKSTGIRKDWLIRYFFIKDGKLFYVHESEELVGKRNVSARQVANLLISTAKEVSDIEFQIISPGQRSAMGGGVYELQGDSSEDMNDWVRVIRQQIEGALVQTLSSDNNMQGTAAALLVPTQSILEELRTVNPCCADCGAASPEWASINLCIMVCIECSGVHRKLGTHISKVRSITLDKWTFNSLQLLITIGNERSNAVWEASLAAAEEEVEAQHKATPSSTPEEREKYIHSKYVTREYVFARDATREQKESHLLKSAENGDLVGTMAAIAAGADINVRDENMRTAMHHSCFGSHVLCVELLCQLGATIDLADIQGLTPFEIARNNGFSDIMDILNPLISRNSENNLLRSL